MRGGIAFSVTTLLLQNFVEYFADTKASRRLTTFLLIIQNERYMTVVRLVYVNFSKMYAQMSEKSR